MKVIQPISEQIRCHWERAPMQTVWRISSRWPAWSKWKLVGPRPHGERWPFDSKGLAFASEAEALKALQSLKQSNDGEFMLIHSWREA